MSRPSLHETHWLDDTGSLVRKDEIQTPAVFSASPSTSSEQEQTYSRLLQIVPVAKVLRETLSEAHSSLRKQFLEHTLPQPGLVAVPLVTNALLYTGWYFAKYPDGDFPVSHIPDVWKNSRQISEAQSRFASGAAPYMSVTASEADRIHALIRDRSLTKRESDALPFITDFKTLPGSKPFLDQPIDRFLISARDFFEDLEIHRRSEDTQSLFDRYMHALILYRYLLTDKLSDGRLFIAAFMWNVLHEAVIYSESNNTSFALSQRGEKMDLKVLKTSRSEYQRLANLYTVVMKDRRIPAKQEIENTLKGSRQAITKRDNR